MVLRNSRAPVLAVVLALLAGWAARAQGDSPQQDQQGSPLRQLSLEELGKVEVTTASKDPRKLRDTPAAIFVITQEDIRRSGATNIPEALRLAPGVQVSRIDGDHWSVSIRGFAGQFSKSLLVLIDGRTVYTPLYAGVYWNVQNVLLDDVDRIEVIRGPGGTIWGANAVNGVINIITKDSEDTHGTLLTLGAGNVDQAVGGARFGGSLGKGFNYRIYGIGSIGGPEFHSDQDNFDHSRMGQFGFHADWKKDNRNTFTVQGDLYRQQNGERLDLASFSPPAETQADDVANFSGGNLLVRWRHTGEGSDTQIQGYFDRTNLQDLELGETRDTFDLDFIQHVHASHSQELTWGFGARVSPSNFIQTSAGVNFLPSKQTDTIYSGFLQDELPVVRDKITFTLGTKLEHNNFSGFDYQPTARLLWTPTEKQSFWAAVTRAVRTPSRLDQDVEFNILAQAAPPAPVYLQIDGDPNLKPEQLIGYEVGYRSQIGRNLYFDLATFYNRYSDLQGYGPLSLAESEVPPPLHLFIVVPYANAVEGHSIGGEVAPDWKINSWWQIRGSYSFLEMNLKDQPGYSDVGAILSSYLGSSPRSMVGMQSFFNLPKQFEFDQTYQFSGALPALAVKPYSTLDLRLGWRAKNGLAFSIVGQNLLTPAHEEFGGDPGLLVDVRRAVFAKITWRM